MTTSRTVEFRWSFDVIKANTSTSTVGLIRLEASRAHSANYEIREGHGYYRAQYCLLWGVPFSFPRKNEGVGARAIRALTVIVGPAPAHDSLFNLWVWPF